MKKLLTPFLLLLSFSVAATTDITTPTVSGVWSLSGSPYKIFNNITVSSGGQLTIEAGVEVIFQGNYSIQVPAASKIRAVGFAGQRIIFRTADTSGWSDSSLAYGGWAGIIVNGDMTTLSPANVINFSFCDFQDLKNGQIKLSRRNVSFSNCGLSHCINFLPSIYSFIDYFVDGDAFFKMDSCELHDNVATGYGTVVRTYAPPEGTIYIGHSRYYLNEVLTTIYCGGGAVVMEHNRISDNTQVYEQPVAGTVTVKDCNALIRGNMIYRNTNQYCAAIVSDNSFSDIKANMICNNKVLVGFTGSTACGVAQGGGAIRLSAYDTSQHIYATVRDNVIANNETAFTGGAVYVFMVGARIFNNTIVNNAGGSYPQASGGINIHCPWELAGKNRVSILNNIFSGNTGYGVVESRAVYMSWADTVEYAYNYAVAGYSEVVDDAAARLHGMVLLGDTTTNVTAPDPGIIDATVSPGSLPDALHKNFALKAGSVCIDKGNGALIAPDSVDATWHPRIYGAAIDLGAHEYGPWTSTIGPLGVKETHEQRAAITLFPNPATNVLFARLPFVAGSLQLVDVAGNLVLSTVVKQELTAIPVHDLPRGVYMLGWTRGGERLVQRLVLQ